MKKFILTMLCIFAALAPAWAQQRQIKGVVVDTEGEPLIGATVMVKGTSRAAMTDLDGNFTLSADPKETLQVSYVGFKRQEVKIGNQTDFKITLTSDASTLDEMVVVGYGTMKKADLTGAVTNVGGAKLEEMHAVGVTQALQGQMPGVQVTRSSGLPGASGTIRVRGVTTIGDSDPLVIVDGVPDSLESVNAADIESISVLKDAASASIYGARAAAGVILVTTKKAKEGKAKVEYQGTAGFVEATERPEMADIQTYMKMMNEYQWNEGGNRSGQEHQLFSPETISNYYNLNAIDPDEYPIYDWQKALIRKTAPTTKHDLKVSYGNKIIQSKISLGYEYTEALYKNRDYQRLTARINNTYKVTKWLTFGLDAYWRRGNTDQPQHNPLYSATYVPMIYAGQWSDGALSPGRDGTNPYGIVMFGGRKHQVTDRFGGKFSIILNPFEGFSITGVYSPGMVYTRIKDQQNKIGYYSKDDRSTFAGYLNNRDQTNLTENRNYESWCTKQLFMNYKKTFAEAHNTDFMVGYEDYYHHNNTIQAGSTNMETEYFYLANANKNQLSVDGGQSEFAYRSIFGRINYNYKGRYLAQFNARWDRSSRFAKKYRTGFFPSASVGWVISEESFLRDVDPKILSFLKLRGSYGTLGNERIGNYPYQAMLSFNNVWLWTKDGKVTADQSVSQTAYNVEDITWETTHTWDIGLDANFLNSRLNLTFDYYYKTTKDMLLSIQIPKYMGYSNPKQNAGDMHTRGWDLTIGWRDVIGDFNYGISVNLSDYRSRMGKMSGTVLDSDGKITTEGQYFNSWYGYKSDGLYQSQEEIDNTPHLNGARPGDIKYVDISGPDGVPDGQITPEYDRVVLGSSLPEFLFGGSLNFGWKGIELSAQFQGVGHQNVMKSKQMTFRGSAYRNFPAIIVGKYWSHYNTPEQNLAAQYPALTESSDSAHGQKLLYQTSDFWMFNGGYFRIKNITLGYNFQPNITKMLHVDNLRVFASVSDPFCFDRFPKGWDPECNSEGTSYIARTWNFGITVGF